MTAAQPGATFDVWENIRGTRLAALRSDSRFPNNPEKAQTLTRFDTPLNRGNNYGARVNTYYQVITIA